MQLKLEAPIDFYNLITPTSLSMFTVKRGFIPLLMFAKVVAGHCKVGVFSIRLRTNELTRRQAALQLAT